MNQNRPDNAPTPRIVTLDFNGGSHIYRNPALGLTVPVRIAPSGISADRAHALAAALNSTYTDSHVHFEVGTTSSETASAVRIGRTSDFDRYGAFLGLAEGIGSGDAFVLLDASANDAELAAVIRHEAGHILGTLDHGGTGLARYAWKHEQTDYFFAIHAYNEPSDFRRYLKRKTTTTVTYKYVSVPSDLQDVKLEYHENGTTIDNDWRSYGKVYNSDTQSYVFPSTPATEYVNQTSEVEAYRDGSGLSVVNLSVNGCNVSGCSVSGTLYVGSSFDYDYQYVRDDWWNLDGGYSSLQNNYKYHQGSASGCVVGGLLSVDGYGTARQCLTNSLTVRGSFSSTLIQSGTELEQSIYEHERHNGVAENCIVTGGTLSVYCGGLARDIVVRSGKVDIGMDYFYLSSSFTDDERQNYLQDYGKAQASSLIVENGNVVVRNGGELHTATIDGSLSASQGAVLGGVITCTSVHLGGVTPSTNITIKLDLNDYAVPNYEERIDDTVVYYYANYTTKTVDFNTWKVISTGTFDNKDNRFNMKDWKYTFKVNAGEVDELAVHSIVMDFGGTEKDFDEGIIGFTFPATYEEIPFQINSNKKNYEISRTFYSDGSLYSSSLIYNGTLYGDAADVLWLEFGWDENVEYTVDLPSMMTGATKELTITDSDSGNETMWNSRIQGATLVVPGGNADTANLVVTAEDADKRDHSCDLELIVVPEEVPILGKEGTKKYSEMLRKAQKNHITSEIKDVLPYNIHTKFFGMSFDLTNMGISLKVDWTAPTMTLKLQGKMEWAIGKGTAGTGKQLKLVVDLSGDNYISVTSTGGKTYSWDLVGEIKIPDFKIGKFEFSNMSLKVDKGNAAFSVSAYVKLPWIKYAFGGSIGIVDGYLDSMAIGVDGLNVPLGHSGLFLQKIEGGIKGIATELNLTFEGTLGLTAGPKVSVDFGDWLGIDSGEYSLCELTLTGSISTAGDLTGSASLLILAGLASGNGSASIKGGAITVTGNFSFLNGCISIQGKMIAGGGNITITGTGTATVPRETIFGPLAGLGMSANVGAVVTKDARTSYVMAWEQLEVFGNVFTVGFKSTFEGEVTLLGSTNLLKKEDTSKLRMLRSNIPVQSESLADALRGPSEEPSASETVTVNYTGVSLFQFGVNGIVGTSVSLTCDGTEYTQEAIMAGLYDNMQVVNALTGKDFITIAVNNAQSGDWTMNVYGDAGATFGVYSLEGGVRKPAITTITVGADARSATIGYELGDLAGLTDVQLSVYVTEKDAGYTGQLLTVIASPESDGSWEWIMDDDFPGGDYSFYLVIESEGQSPVQSDISAAYTFRTIDTEAPDQIQIIRSEWKSSGTVVTWDAPWDDTGVAGYKIRYASGDEDMTEADVKTTTFTFDKVPNGTYDFQIAAYDAAGNLSAWSEQQSCLVLTVGNAICKDATLTEDLSLAEYESAVNITAGGFEVGTAANSLVSGSVLGNAGISGIVENTTIDGAVTLYDSAEGYGLTVNGTLTIGGTEPVPEVDITKLVPADDGGDGEATGSQAGDEAVVTFTGAVADGITVKDGGKLIIGANASVRNVTVEAGGSLVLEDMADFDRISLAYGAGLIVRGGKDSSFRLTGDIWTAGSLSTYRLISGGGHKIHFEQYKQTSEYKYVGTDYTTDDVALLPDMDKIVGKTVDVVIDSSVYGSFKIADEAEYFDGTITVTDSVDGTSAEVGFDKLVLVGNALCSLSRGSDGTLWLLTARSKIGTPTLTVENADSDAYDTIYLTATEAEDSGFISQYIYRYSRNADMSDAVTITSSYSGSTSISKYDLVDNATYYAQACVENTNGVKSLWSDAVSFTVVPKLLPDAPTTLTVSGATNDQSERITFTATGVDDSNYTVREYRFRYADNPEMENAIVITTGQRLINYASISKSDIVDGKDYYVQAGVKHANDWSYWSDIVVFNTQGWDYENITIGPEPDGDYNYFSLNGSSAKNVTVIQGGYFYGGGAVDGLTVEAGGFFRDDNSSVTNAVVNGGSYWLDSGNVTGIVVNGGELRLMNGTLNGATIGKNASVSLGSSYSPTITGTILIQGSISIYYYHAGVTTDASFVFDLGAHETDKDKAYIDYTSPLLGTRTFTVKLDDTPEIGDYRMSYTPNSGEFYASLSAADGTNLGIMGIGMDAVAHDGLYYSLVDQKGVTYLHVSDSLAPAFVGAVKLSKDGAVYDSDTGYYDLEVSAEGESDYVLVGEGGQVSYITVGNGGSVDVFGNVYGATVENGGRLTLKEGGCAAADIITVETGGNVTVEGGKVDLGAAIHLAGGTLTVNGVLQGMEDDSGPWGPTNHWFVFELDTLAALPSGPMISDYSLLQCNPMFTATVSPDQAKGEYKLAGNAAGFTGYISFSYGDEDDWTEFLAVGNECTYGDVRYALAVKKGVLTLTVGEDVTEPDTYAAKGDIDGNGVSDVLFVWTGANGEGNYQHGYWMNGTSEWRSANVGHPAEWENLGCHDMTGDGKADSVLVGNVVVNGVKGAYIGFYADADDADANWTNIGYLNNADDIAWKNKVGNLTGSEKGANSIVWYAPELYALGAWTDGTDSWTTISNSFGGDDWALVGCGDFNGDGKDSVVMSGLGGQYFYAADLDGTVTSMGSANWSGWEVRAIGDFAGDGRDDLVLFHPEYGSMVMLANGNLDDFTSIGQLDANDWFVVGAGDYNGDQQDDLLVRQYSTGMLGYYANGDTTNWNVLGYGVDMNWTVIA